jgi:hypothetical protein
LIKVHTPENSFAVSCLDMTLVQQARGKLKLIMASEEDSTTFITKSNTKIEEDFLLSNSDKLLFLMREFKYQLSPEMIF